MSEPKKKTKRMKGKKKLIKFFDTVSDTFWKEVGIDDDEDGLAQEVVDTVIKTGRVAKHKLSEFTDIDLDEPIVDKPVFYDKMMLVWQRMKVLDQDKDMGPEYYRQYRNICKNDLKTIMEWCDLLGPKCTNKSDKRKFSDIYSACKDFGKPDKRIKRMSVRTEDDIEERYDIMGELDDAMSVFQSAIEDYRLMNRKKRKIKDGV